MSFIDKSQPAEREDVPVLAVVESGEMPPVKQSFKGVNIGGDVMMRATAELPEEHRLLVRWLYNTARERNWDWPTLERQTGMSPSVLYKVFSDKYRYSNDHAKAGLRVPLDSVCVKISKMKAEMEAKEVQAGDFINTTVWERTSWLCDRVFHRKKMGFIYGDSQDGKTTCLKQYQRTHNGGQTLYFECPPMGGVQLMMRCIAKALHVNSRTSSDHLIEDICNALDSSRLLLVDEVHRVFTTYQKTSVMRSLELLRYIHDQTKCGMVLCGTNVFRDHFSEGEFFKYLKQLERRGLYTIQLGLPQRADIDLISRHYGLPTATGRAEEQLVHLAKLFGVGMVFTRLNDARDYARKRGEKLKWSHFERVLTIIQKAADGMMEEEAA